MVINMALFLKQPVITYCPRVLYNYLKCSNSLTTSAVNERKIIDHLARFKEIEKLLSNYRLLEKYQDDYRLYYLLSINGTLSISLIGNRQGHYHQAIERLFALADPEIFNARTLTRLILKKRLYLRPVPFIRHYVGLYLLFAGSWSLYRHYCRLTYTIYLWVNGRTIRQFISNLRFFKAG